VKRNFIALLFSTFLISTSWSQNTNLDYRNGLKIYNLITFEENFKSIRLSDTSSYQFTNTSTQILHPTIAFQWKAQNNNFHEIELTNFEIGKTGAKTEFIADTNGIPFVSGQDIVTTAISVRYEYILTFNKSKDNKLVPSLGVGVNPYFGKNKYSPLTSNSFPSSESSFGLRAFITPRITYFFTPKIFVDFNIPLCLFDNFIKSETLDNANLPVEERSVSTFNFNQFPNFFSGRIGLGLKL
jgi:hypothetical protein